MSKRWYVIYRNESRLVENMITGYSDRREASENFRMWAEWDAVRATVWELVSFPRTCEPRLRKKKNAADPDVLEFHDVLDDLDRAADEQFEIVERITREQLGG